MATATSPSCSTFFNFSCTTSPQGRRRSADTHCSVSCRKLDRVASWVGSGLAAAFFASLEKCSCINISTEGDGDDSNEQPLICNKREDVETHMRRKAGKGKKKGGMLEDINVY